MACGHCSKLEGLLTVNVWQMVDKICMPPRAGVTKHTNSTALSRLLGVKVVNLVKYSY